MIVCFDQYSKSLKFFASWWQYLKWRSSDHLECDISSLPLDPAKLNQIDSILNTSILKSEELIKNASRTDFHISPHLVFRYLNSVEFGDKYHGERWRLSLTVVSTLQSVSILIMFFVLKSYIHKPSHQSVFVSQCLCHVQLIWFWSILSKNENVLLWYYIRTYDEGLRTQ